VASRCEAGACSMPAPIAVVVATVDSMNSRRVTLRGMRAVYMKHLR
jgi:hypothetical protein